MKSIESSCKSYWTLLFKMLKIHSLSVLLLNASRMPWLSLEQQKQAIWRLNSGQQPQLVAQAFNCNVCTIQRLREHYNTTNSINDWPCSGRPRVTTPCQDMYILWQHMINQFTRASKHHDNLQPQEANLICMFNISFGFTNKFVFPAHHTQFFFQLSTQAKSKKWKEQWKNYRKILTMNLMVCHHCLYGCHDIWTSFTPVVARQHVNKN